MDDNQEVTPIAGNDIPKKKMYLVYMNKAHNCWARDAYSWMKKHGYEESDFEEIISEVAFMNFSYIDNHENTFKFCTEILTEH